MVYNLLEGGFEDEPRSRAVLDITEAVNPDVVIYPEAFNEDGNIRALDAAKFALQDQGYVVEGVANEDDDDRSDRRGLVAASKVKNTEIEVVRLMTRNALRVTGLHPEDQQAIDVFGVHLEDRSEDGRLWQAGALLKEAAYDRTILAGDFNAMHANAPIARVLRAMGPLANRLPAGEPGTHQSKLARIGSLSQRLAEMADGRTMEAMVKDGFIDADPKRQATIRRLGLLAVQLDHIMVGDGLEATDFYIANDIVGKYAPRGMKISDHFPIVATVGAAEN